MIVGIRSGTALVSLAFAAGAAACDGPRAGGASARTFEPCVEVACASKDELLRMFAGPSGSAGPRRARASTERGNGTAAGAAASAAAAGTSAVAGRAACPPDREELGRHAWNFLHSVAAYYPEQPTAEEKAAARGLVETLRLLYPCSHCRAQLAVDLARLPVEPALASRAALSVWMCRQHNLVNEALGKPPAPCDLASLDVRWRSGRPSCWGAAAAAEAATAEESMGRAPPEEEAAERAEAAAEAAGGS